MKEAGNIFYRGRNRCPDYALSHADIALVEAQAPKLMWTLDLGRRTYTATPGVKHSGVVAVSVFASVLIATTLCPHRNHTTVFFPFM
jgi:hypothetical protein